MSIHPHKRFQHPNHPIPVMAVLAAVLTLASCATIPQDSPRTSMAAVGKFSSAASLSGNQSSWPEDHWWEDYGDSQLNQLIEQALQGSPDMAVAIARLHQAEAAAGIARAAQQPQLSANASVTSQKQSENYLTPKAMVPEGWREYGRVTLDFSWEIDFWGRQRSGLAAAISEASARTADVAQARLTLASSIATSYAELTRLYALLDTGKATEDIRRKQADLVARRVANGLETQGAVKEAEARLAAAEMDVLQLTESISLQCNRLAALTGAGPDRALSIGRPAIALRRTHGLPSEVAANLLGRRPDITAARLQVEAMEHRIGQKRAEFYPNVNLAAFIGVQSMGLDLLAKSGSRIGSVGPAISLPIFNGGRLRAELRGAQASHDEAVALYERALNQALHEVGDAYLSQKSLGPQLQKARDAYAASRSAYEITKNRYEGGLSNYLEVLSAQDTMEHNQRALSDLQSRVLVLDISLIRALGGGYQTPFGASGE